MCQLRTRRGTGKFHRGSAEEADLWWEGPGEAPGGEKTGISPLMGGWHYNIGDIITKKNLMKFSFSKISW